MPSSRFVHAVAYALLFLYVIDLVFLLCVRMCVAQRQLAGVSFPLSQRGLEELR